MHKDEIWGNPQHHVSQNNNFQGYQVRKPKNNIPENLKISHGYNQ